MRDKHREYGTLLQKKEYTQYNQYKVRPGTHYYHRWDGPYIYYGGEYYFNVGYTYDLPSNHYYRVLYKLMRSFKHGRTS